MPDRVWVTAYSPAVRFSLRLPEPAGDCYYAYFEWWDDVGRRAASD
jgi:hypothetical protein